MTDIGVWLNYFLWRRTPQLTGATDGPGQSWVREVFVPSNGRCLPRLHSGHHYPSSPWSCMAYKSSICALPDKCVSVLRQESTCKACTHPRTLWAFSVCVYMNERSTVISTHFLTMKGIIISRSRRVLYAHRAGTTASSMPL